MKAISPFFIILDQYEMFLTADQEHLDFIMSEYALESYSAYDSDGYRLLIRLDPAAFPSTFTVKREDRPADLDGLCRLIRLRMHADDEYGLADRLEALTDIEMLEFLRIRASDRKREDLRPGTNYLPVAIGLALAALVWYLS